MLSCVEYMPGILLKIRPNNCNNPVIMNGKVLTGV